MLILEFSQPVRSADNQVTDDRDVPNDLPEQCRRKTPIAAWQAAGTKPAAA